jgi:TatD DNase family protein
MENTKLVPLADTHCHVDLYPNPMALIEEIEAARIYTIALTNTPSVFPMMQTLSRDKKYLRPALGLHPELAYERIGELPLFDKYLHETRYVGEVGLDYVTSDRTNKFTQRRAFEHIVNTCHIAGSKILTVHSRRAARDVIEIIPENFNSKVILHWYSDSTAVLHKALDKGCYFSFNLAMVRSYKGRSLLQKLPSNRLLTESDGPFIQNGNEPVRPFDMNLVITAMAQELGMPDHELQTLLYKNFHALLTTHQQT